jgi:hypothetical protein
MNGIMFHDGHRHHFLPVEGGTDARERAIMCLSTPTLQRIHRQGIEPIGGMNLAPDMRLVAAELERREERAELLDRAQEAATQTRLRRRWLGPELTNYGRTR